MTFHSFKALKRPAALAVLICLLAGLLFACTGPGAPSGTAKPAATEPPTLEIPDISRPADSPEVEIPESYGLTDTMKAALKVRELRKYEALSDYVVLRDGGFFGFAGLRCFEFVYGDRRHVLNLIDGRYYAPARGLAEAFSWDYEASGDGFVFSRSGFEVAFPEGKDEVRFGDAVKPFRRPVRIGDQYYIDAENLAKLLDYSYAVVEEDGWSYVEMLPAEQLTEDRLERSVLMRFDEYDKLIYGLDEVDFDRTGVGLYPPTEPSERLVGVAYTTWFRSDSGWGEGKTWDMPLLGKYTSDNRDVIRQHGIWLRDAGVDCVFVDWSNDIGYDPATMRSQRADFRMIEEATETLFEVWSELPGAPKICIFTGPGHVQGTDGFDAFSSGRMAEKNRQIWDTFLANKKFSDMYFRYEGKPLLLCYAATPSFIQDNKSPFKDDRFTVRWITGYVGQQSNLFDKETLVSKMFWSWEERGAQTFTVQGGRPEAMTISAATRAQGNEGGPGYIPAAGRQNGETFRRQWARAKAVGVKLALIVSFNEWTVSEQHSLEISKDVEPSETLGTFYLDLMREEIRSFKGQR